MGSVVMVMVMWMGVREVGLRAVRRMVDVPTRWWSNVAMDVALLLLPTLQDQRVFEVSRGLMDQS